MKQNKHLHKTGQHKEQGFSLLEVLISIVILVIIMAPIMNNFIRSMEMNKKAKDIQIQSNLAANIVEGMKAFSLQQVTSQFNGPVGNFKIIDASSDVTIDDVEQLDYDGSTYEEYNSTDEQSTYYFTIHGIKIGSTAYDALITLDPDPYHPAGETIMNNYPIPDIINLDKAANTLLLSNGSSGTDDYDTAALATYKEWGSAYTKELYDQSPEYQAYLISLEQWENKCEEAQMKNETLPPKPTEPPFLDTDPRYQPYKNEEMIKGNITKKMTITVTASDTVNYQIDYYCSWPTSDLEQNIHYQVGNTKYAKDINNIYLFIKPSIFDLIHADEVILDNRIASQASAKTINLFLAKQDSPIANPQIIINRSPSDKFNIYTDFQDGNITSRENGIITTNDNINKELVKTKEEDRIYDIRVQIFEYVNAGPNLRFRKEFYKLDTTLN